MTKFFGARTVYLVLGLAFVSCGGGGGGSLTAQELCDQGAASGCQKIFSCSETAAFRLFVGGTEQACVPIVRNMVCPGNAPCGAGATYHPDKAEQCLSAVKGLGCAQIATLVGGLPPACDAVCTATDASGG